MEKILETKPTNPKDLVGINKLPLHIWPETATAMGCIAMLDGAGKYGRSNYRGTDVKASIYYDACKRHLNSWFEGEDNDLDSGLPNLAHAIACIAIIIDAGAAKTLNDDRAFKGGYRELVDRLTPLVPMLIAKHADRSPHHYTIKDQYENI